MDIQFLTELSDSDLLARVQHLTQNERRATAALIAHLGEIENRKLYLGQACSSLFMYCMRVLHLSEPAAYNRIQAARAARRFPAVLASLEQGLVHLTAVRLLAPVLTLENHHELLAAATHKSKREVEELVAHLRPQPDVQGRVRKLPAAPAPGVASRGLASGEDPRAARAAGARAIVPPSESRSGDPAGGVVQAERREQPEVASAACVAPAAPALALTSPSQKAVVVPLAPERYKVQFTAGAATREKLRRAQELLRHRIPDGDVAQVFDLALDLLVQDLEKKKFAATDRPRRSERETEPVGAKIAARPGAQPGRPSPGFASRRSGSQQPPSQPSPSQQSPSRHIPAAVRRAVWQRDEGRCAFVTKDGERCTERAGLEFDHIRPHADGGGVEPENVRLLCRQHNQYEARQFFGVWHADAAREPVPRCG